MPELSNSNVQRARLNFFLQDRLVPVLARFEQPGNSDFVHAELLESFLWLHHGVGIEYFPLAEARLVMYEKFPYFLRAHNGASQEPHWETWFTSTLRAIFEAEFSGKIELFSVAQPVKVNLAGIDVYPLFQSFLIAATGFAENKKTRPFVQALAAADDTTWANIISKNEFVHSVERPAFEPLRDVMNPNWTHQGLFASLDYMQAFRAAMADAKRTYVPPLPELLSYLHLLRETQQWRLNFGYPRERERFIEAGRHAAQTYVQQFSELDESGKKDLVQNFIKELRDLMTDWGAPITKAAGA